MNEYQRRTEKKRNNLTHHYLGIYHNELQYCFCVLMFKET